MPIAVKFRGPMLFVTNEPAANEVDDVVDGVVIPDGEARKAKHADKTKAARHTAGLLVIRRGGPRMYVPLRGQTVRISADGEDRAPGVDNNFLLVPPVHDMTNPSGTAPAAQVRRKPPVRSAATVSFHGGRMSGEMITEHGIELPIHLAQPQPRALCSMPVWQSPAERGTIVLEGDNPGVIEIDADVEVFLFNWDMPFPPRGDLIKTIPLNPPFQDDDFKWIYDLLQPPQGSWETWLGSDPFLPAPRSVGFLTAITPQTPGNPSTGTCDSARFRGPLAI